MTDPTTPTGETPGSWTPEETHAGPCDKCGRGLEAEVHCDPEVEVGRSWMAHHPHQAGTSKRWRGGYIGAPLPPPPAARETAGLTEQQVETLRTGPYVSGERLWDALRTIAREADAERQALVARADGLAAEVDRLDNKADVLRSCASTERARAEQLEQRLTRLRNSHERGCPAIADDESDQVLGDYGECACLAARLTALTTEHAALRERGGAGGSYGSRGSLGVLKTDRHPRGERHEGMSREDENGIATVRTSPCPRCRSNNTQATLLRGVVMWRICCSCLLEWDCDESIGENPMLSHEERLSLILKGGIKNEASRHRERGARR